MQYLLKQPLLHFLLIGLTLFLIFQFTSNKYEDVDSKTVIVDKDTLLTFIQYRSKAFNQKHFEEKLNNLSEQELKLLIDDFIREEVLYREALALNLDEDDYVLRRRLVQKLEFINQGFVNSSLNFSDEELNNYFNENIELYKVEPYITFTHVFFNNEEHGKETARELALKEFENLNKNKVPFSKSVEHGDRFLYHLNYVERVPDFVASHFGPEMSKALFALEPSDTIWNGPYESPYGFHLVMLTINENERYPELDEIYDRVKQDARYKYTKEETEKSIQEIIDSYDVKIVYKNNENKKSNKTASLKESD